MSFPAKAPSGHPPGLKLGVFAGGGPFPRLVAPGIVVDDPAQQLGLVVLDHDHDHLDAAAWGDVSSFSFSFSSSSSSSRESSYHAYVYARTGGPTLTLTHVLTRRSAAAYIHPGPHPHWAQNGNGSGNGNGMVPVPVTLLVIEEQQTLREVVELLVRVRVALPRACILVGEPFVAVAYLMAIEGRDLLGTWRLVTGESLSRKVFREVHAVLGKFAKDVEEEGKKLAREEGRR
jgi:hypothetical protein